MFDFIKPPHIARSFFKDLVFSIPNKQNEIYLTFDDGPNPGTTEKILEILSSYKVKATFFCLGKNVEKHPSLFEKIIEEGHAIGNHGYDHLNGWKTNTTVYLENAVKAKQLIKSSLYRPPYGKLTPNQIKRLKKGFKIIMWDVSALDYRSDLKPESVYQNVIKHVSSGSIIVMHDSEKAKGNIKCISAVIETLLSKSFIFKQLKV